LRTRTQKLKDFVTFPLRAVALFYRDRWGLSSLASERFDYVAREVRGHCLDVGCGPHNRFVGEYLGGNGVGVDVFPYDGLTGENILEDPTQFPFRDGTFDAVTFIACLNHVPKPLREVELAEAYRCLKPGGNIIVTMGNPLAEILAHRAISLYDRLFGTTHDLDSVRGMSEEEDYYLRDREIVRLLASVGFANITKKRFLTQWGLNHELIAWKRAPIEPAAPGEHEGAPE